MNKVKITVALAGNPNSGKTTLFNLLTGSRQQVGNYPGITVEKKEGFVDLENYTLHFIDLPGTYSLTAYSLEERVARNFLVKERPDLVVNVVNASALERNLYLTVQLLELGAPLILALNMMDEAKAMGITINTQLLAKRLGCPVVETVAREGKGKDVLVHTIIREYLQKPQWKPVHISYGPDIDPVLNEIQDLLAQKNFTLFAFPLRWIALKFLENDEEIRTQIAKFDSNLYQELETLAQKLNQHCEKTLETYPEAIIADYRYGFISSLLKDVIFRDTQRERLDFSDKLDRILTHKCLGPIIMLSVLYGVYKLTFVLGAYPLDWINAFFNFLAKQVDLLLPDGMLKSLLISGVIGGVGGVVSFVPLIAIMFLFLSFLEDSGYMARVAYMLDRVFRTFGLHGQSIMPFIISGGIAGGCAVPGVMAARTLRSPKERLATVLTVPFMTCGAKLPVFILLTSVFFPKEKTLALFSISLLGWIVALLVAKLLRSTLIRGLPTPFVMELPPYRLPTLEGLFIHSWEKTWMYLKKAGTVILAISIGIWLLMSFPKLPVNKKEPILRSLTKLEQQIKNSQRTDVSFLLSQKQALQNQLAQEQLVYSYAGRLGRFLERFTLNTLGFDWRVNLALIGGFAAKEVIISTLGTVYALDGERSVSLAQKLSADPFWTRAKAVSLMVFVLLYAPCMVTIVTIAKEESLGWAGFALFFNTMVGFILASIIYQLALRF